MDEFIVHQYIESNSKAIYQLYIFSNDCLVNIYLVENNKLRNYKCNLNHKGTLVEKYELYEYLRDNYKKFVFVNMTTHIIMSDDKHMFNIPLCDNNKQSKLLLQNDNYSNNDNYNTKIKKSKYSILTFLLSGSLLMMCHYTLTNIYEIIKS
jgi:hypothetical protein